ncbi:zinc finger protein 444-like [Lynx canadensis]|uniref:zinc finger protein 444-like n=1 Tax=Lynx canadensis TaxID=61383 RepID=UPI0011B09340|nr:zinc finger protein 444-like [Lynx canadensis]
MCEEARCPCGARDPMGGPVSPAREAGRPGCRGPGPGLTVAPLPPLPPGRRARAPARALGLLRRAVPGMAAARGAHQGAEMELLVLEQFLSALPQTSRPGCASRGPKSGEDAVDMLEEIWGPAMRAPQDVTEGSGVAVGKEDGVMMPLGDAVPGVSCWRRGTQAAPLQAGAGALRGPGGHLRPAAPEPCRRTGTASDRVRQGRPEACAPAATGRATRARSRTPAPSAARPSGARSTCGATAARTPAARGRPAPAARAREAARLLRVRQDVLLSEHTGAPPQDALGGEDVRLLAVRKGFGRREHVLRHQRIHGGRRAARGRRRAGGGGGGAFPAWPLGYARLPLPSVLPGPAAPSVPAPAPLPARAVTLSFCSFCPLPTFVLRLRSPPSPSHLLCAPTGAASLPCTCLGRGRPPRPRSPEVEPGSGGGPKEGDPSPSGGGGGERTGRSQWFPQDGRALPVGSLALLLSAAGGV